MDRRKIILVGVFGGAILVLFVRGVVFPEWIAPLLTIDDRIVKREEDLATLQAEEKRVEKARYEYRDWAARNASFDPNRVVLDVRELLTRLIEKHKLQDSKVNPTRISEDRKTKLSSTTVTVSGIGTLESAIGFLRDLSEAPQLLRLGNVVLSPASTGGKTGGGALVTLRVPVELWVVPQHRMVGRLESEKLPRPEATSRHAERDYSPIWTGEPFSDFVPLQAQATPSFNVETGGTVILDVSASGGTPPYAYEWSPAEGLSKPDATHPHVDTSTVGNKRYTVTVTDARGRKATGVAAVSVREPPKPAEPVVVQNKPTPPPDNRPKRWPDGVNMQVTMALLTGLGESRVDEFMVHNRQSGQTSFYKVGDDFDGGELVFVHQTGGVVHRRDGYFVYPLGATLDHAVEATQATDFPDLQGAVERHQVAVRKAAETPAESKPVEQPATLNGAQSVPDGAEAVPAATGPGEAPPSDGAAPAVEGASGADAPQPDGANVARPAERTPPRNAAKRTPPARPKRGVPAGTGNR
ncbi:MAG: hypothetical protein AABZ12_08490 [Planctomycetota bacterium]